MRTILEICAGDIVSVRAAADAGAQRVEVCSALALGGLTPSVGFIREAVSVPGMTVHVLIRHREGDFVYSEAEVRAMERDIAAAADAGAHGVVVGALLPDGTIDMATCRRLVSAAKGRGLRVTFHRAFDRVQSPERALEQVIELGCDYLLTSGCAPSALEGAPLLRRLRVMAAGRITIIAAAGINSGNAAEVVHRSGCTQIHASARSAAPSAMEFHRHAVAMGSADGERLTTDFEEVTKILSVI